MRILSCLVLCLGCALAHAQDPAQVEAPSPKLGDQRLYRVIDGIGRQELRQEDSVVTAVSAERIEVTERNSGTVSVYDAALALLAVGDLQYKGRIEALQFPMSVGKRWTHRNEGQHASCGNTVSELKNTVNGWEDVKVPAGSFRALRIDSEGRWRNGCGSDRLQYKFWYVPALRWLVRSESWSYASGRPYTAEIRELMSFKLAD